MHLCYAYISVRPKLLLSFEANQIPGRSVSPQEEGEEYADAGAVTHVFLRSTFQKRRATVSINHRKTPSIDTAMSERVILRPTHANGSTPAGSNLNCILEYTTPSVPCQYQSKNILSELGTEPGKSQSESIPFFSLGDLWQSFDEWSAYGVGVPLKLPSGEDIMQYYVPYLSALQIYVHPGSPHKRRLWDESDWSDASDVRDNSSDFGSDTESEKFLSRIRGEQWESSSSISSASSEQGDRLGELTLEYFERCSPYGRAPLSGKISELASRYPMLLSLRSNELSSASWLSVAWYPIYRIPTGATMSDLSTCFLTFHTLSTFPCMQDSGTENRLKTGATYLPWEARYQHENERSSFLPSFCSCKLDQEHWLQEQSAWRIKSGMLELPPFGLVSYKLKGPFWASAGPADQQRAFLFAKGAESWLRHFRVQHPDYEFFVSRETIKFDR